MSDGATVSEAVEGWAAARTAAGEFGEPKRPRSLRDGGVVELREVTGESLRAVCALVVAPEQRGYVAPNAVSIAEAHFEPKAWFRAVYADGVPVGFVMLSDDPETPEYFLWRLMIADAHQRKGYGRRAVELLAEHVRARPNATELLVSWVPGEGGPEAFYRSLGFEPTGAVEDGEVVARLALDG